MLGPIINRVYLFSIIIKIIQRIKKIWILCQALLPWLYYKLTLLLWDASWDLRRKFWPYNSPPIWVIAYPWIAHRMFVALLLWDSCRVGRFFLQQQWFYVPLSRWWNFIESIRCDTQELIDRVYPSVRSVWSSMLQIHKPSIIKHLLLITAMDRGSHLVIYRRNAHKLQDDYLTRTSLVKSSQ
jgi:hypothetical protein